MTSHVVFAPCLSCGRRLVYRPTRFAWVHVTPQADHAPVPGKPETPAATAATKGDGGMTAGVSGSSSTKEPQDVTSATHPATVPVARRETPQ